MNTSSATSSASMVPLPSLSSMLNACATQLGYSVEDFSRASQSTSAARNSFTSMNPSLVVSSCAKSCAHSSAVMLYPTLRKPASSSSGSTSASPEVSSRSNSSRNSLVRSSSSANTPETGDEEAPVGSIINVVSKYSPVTSPLLFTSSSSESCDASLRSWSPSKRSTERLSSPYVLKRCRRATTCPPMGCSASAAVCCSQGCSSAARAVIRRSGSRSISRITRSRQSVLRRGHGSLVKSAGSSKMARNTSLALGRWFTLSTNGRRPVSSWYATTPQLHTSASSP